MADHNTIARPSAQAAFDVAREAGELSQWANSLEIAAQLFEDGRVAKFLSNPTLDDAKRLEFLHGLFGKARAATFAGGDKRGTNFLKLLIEYDRVAVLPEVAAHFDKLKDEIENAVDVTVASATPLSSAQQSAITKALTARLGRTVNLTTEINESLIGGAVIRAGDVVIDGSLRARLEGLGHALTK